MLAASVIERMFIDVWAWFYALPVNDPLVRSGVSASVHDPGVSIRILVCGASPVSMIQHIRPECGNTSLDISRKAS